jgi:hypothetical protein
MFSRKNIAAVLAVAGLAAAGTVIAAEGAKEQGCAGGNHASAGERHGQGHGMERMQERHARMAAHMSGRHGGHGGEAKQGPDKPKEEEHKH